MEFCPTPLAGVFIVRARPVSDSRGSFARTYCAELFARQGLNVPLPVTARAYNRAALTLRGLHFQAAPHEETKLVSCVGGSVFDVVVDVRPRSPTWGKWFGTTLHASGDDALYVPAGCAHGYLTLTDQAQVLYQITDTHHPAAERGVRWDDPTLRIAWPAAPRVISERDRQLADLTDLVDPAAE